MKKLNILLSCFLLSIVVCLFASDYFWSLAKSNELKYEKSNIQLEINIEKAKNSDDIEALKKIAVDYINYIKYNIKSDIKIMKLVSIVHIFLAFFFFIIVLLIFSIKKIILPR